MQVTYTFDPMTSNCHSLRNFMFFWNTKKVEQERMTWLHWHIHEKSESNE